MKDREPTEMVLMDLFMAGTSYVFFPIKSFSTLTEERRE